MSSFQLSQVTLNHLNTMHQTAKEKNIYIFRAMYVIKSFRLAESFNANVVDEDFDEHVEGTPHRNRPRPHKTFISLEVLLDLPFRNLGTDDSIYSGLICRKVLVGKFGGLLKILKKVYG